MGQGMTIPTGLHVPLSDCKDIVEDTYTVKRTSGMLDPGWVISSTSGSEPNLKGPSASKNCHKDAGVWRIFLDNGKYVDDYVCGWRRLETIYPTRLEGDEEAIRVWRESLVEILEALELKRLEASSDDTEDT